MPKCFFENHFLQTKNVRYLCLIMKILLDIKDDKAAFVMELLRSLKFVKAKPLSPGSSDVLEGLKEAIDQVHLAKQGKVKLKPARQLLDEI
jgi:hypothetical protein